MAVTTTTIIVLTIIIIIIIIITIIIKHKRSSKLACGRVKRVETRRLRPNAIPADPQFFTPRSFSAFIL